MKETGVTMMEILARSRLLLPITNSSRAVSIELLVSEMLTE